MIRKISPNEIYNFAAQSHVGVSFEMPNYTSQVNSIGTLNLLQAIYDCGLAKKQNFIKHPLRNFMEKSKKKNNQKKHLFTLKVHTQLQNYFHIG